MSKSNRKPWSPRAAGFSYNALFGVFLKQIKNSFQPFPLRSCVCGCGGPCVCLCVWCICGLCVCVCGVFVVCVCGVFVVCVCGGGVMVRLCVSGRGWWGISASGSHQWEGLIQRDVGPGSITGQPCSNDFTVLVPRLFSCFQVRERPTRRLGGYLTKCN